MLEPGNKLKPRLAKEGITLARGIQPAITYSFFNMEDPVVGGYTPEKIALRRAIGMAYNVDEEIRVLRAGQAVPATQPMPPNVSGYNPKFDGHAKFDPAAARALLDKFGYVDRDKDGWRDLPDGKPLVLKIATGTAALDRQYSELWQRSMNAVGLRVEFASQKFADNLKAARLGQLQMWFLGNISTTTEGFGFLGAPLRRPRRFFQSGPVQASRVRPALRAGAGDARRTGANEDPATDVRARDDLRPVESPCVSLRERARAALARRLQVQRVQPASLGLL